VPQPPPRQPPQPARVRVGIPITRYITPPRRSWRPCRSLST